MGLICWKDDDKMSGGFYDGLNIKREDVVIGYFNNLFFLELGI